MHSKDTREYENNKQDRQSTYNVTLLQSKPKSVICLVCVCARARAN
jgi:hypothetical protein